jgi:hypothetical protein
MPKTTTQPQQKHRTHAPLMDSHNPYTYSKNDQITKSPNHQTPKPPNYQITEITK